MVYLKTKSNLHEVLSKMDPSKPVTIIGGNISGLSTAYYLSKKGCPVKVYEKKIWDKPCGGAITIEFARYLEKELGITTQTAGEPFKKIDFVFNNGKYVESEGLFVIISRYHLQEQLINRLRREPGIEIIFKKVSLKDHNLFSSQTIAATGFGGLTKKIIKEEWYNREYALTLKCEGKLNDNRAADSHMLYFDSRLKGYGWFFAGKKSSFNMGIGGLIDKKNLYKQYDAFVKLIEKRFSYRFRPTSLPKLWKIPIRVDNWNSPVSFNHNQFEFLGVGDVLGLAHPIIAAGIEPAWQSGWLLAESFDTDKKKFNKDRYRYLMKKNLQLTSRKPLDIVMASMLRFESFPFKDQVSYVLLKLMKNLIINNIKKYPWFAMVHDGTKKTGFYI